MCTTVTRMFHPGISAEGIQNNTENTTIPLYKPTDGTAHRSSARSTARKEKGGINLEKDHRERVKEVTRNRNTWVRREKGPRGFSGGEEQPHEWSSEQQNAGEPHGNTSPLRAQQLCCKSPRVSNAEQLYLERRRVFS